MPDNQSSGKSENKPGNTISRDHYDILMNAPVGVFTAMPNGRVLYVNATAARMLGYDTPEKTIVDITDIYSTLVAEPSDREKLRQRLEDQGEASNFEIQLLRRDQTATWISCNIKAVLSHTGHVSHFEGFLTDIDGRKQTESALQKSENLLARSQRTAKLGNWELDIGANRLTWSDEAYRIFGLTPGQFTATTYDAFLNIVHPADRARVDAAYTNSLREGKDHYEIEHRVISRDSGEVKHVYEKCIHQRDADGKVIRSIGIVQDITRQKKIEEELKHKEQFLETVFNSIQDGISVLDKDLNILRTNQVMKNWYAHSLPLEGRKCYEMYHQRSECCEKCPVSRSLKTGNLEMDEIPLIQENKTTGILELFAFPMLDNTGAPIGVVEYVRDITQRKNAETQLLESEEKYRALVEQSMEMTYLHDLDGNILEVNPASIRHTGYSRDEYSHMNVFDLHPDKTPNNTILRQWKEWRVGQSVTLEKIHLHKNGSALPVEITTGKVRFGGRDYILAQVRDISRRKKAQDDLQESEKRFATAFRSNPAPQVISDIDTGMVIDANDRWLKMIGYTREEIIGRTSKETGIYADPDERDRIIRKLRHQGFFKDEPIALLTRTGETIWALWSAEAIALSGRKVMLSMIYDETERKLAKEEREKLQEQLTHAQKLESVGRLAGGIAHDFNNMLSVIQGYAELAAQKISADDALQNDLEEILKAARRSADITRQLLAFARRQTINPHVLDLNDTVTDTLKMIRRLIGEDIDLAWQPGSNLWPVKMDPVQIDQILANLCVNARDAIAGVGKVTIETENVRIDEAYCTDHAEFFPGEYVMLAVSDDGHGISREIRGQIFEPFFTTKGIGSGTGLGLPTVYGVVKQNKGFINVYSEPGKGSTFKIYLSRHEGQADRTVKVTPTKKIRHGYGETVLIVEDEFSILELTKRMLEELGYTILAANSPSEAIRLATKQVGNIHLLITDVVMPEMSGRDLATLLQVVYPKIRILYMSGYTANVIAHQGVLEKDIAFIQKPFSIKKLAATVRTILEEKIEA